MKILYFIGQLDRYGGVETVLVNKANYLADRERFEVTLLIANQNKRKIVYKISKNVRVIDMAINDNDIFLIKIPVIGFLFKIILLKNKYQKIINKINPDILINVERGFEDFFIPYLKPSRICIRESHSSIKAVKFMDFNKGIKHSFFSCLFNSMLKKYDKVVLLTRQDAMDRNYFNGDVVIPNLVSSFNIDTKYNTKSKKVISVGRLDRFKNFKDQIIVWKEIVRLYPEWTLHIYGDGPEKDNLKKIIRQYHLENNVFLEGKSNRIQEDYARSSFFVFTSLAEGFGMVLVEAMQMGLPVISYNCPCGPKDIISNHKDGLLVNLGDLEMLKQSILKLIEHPELRIEMSKQAIKKSSNYSEKKIMPMWIKLFKQVTNV